jgi:type IV secretory pathway VirB2 component (pilin)
VVAKLFSARQRVAPALRTLDLLGKRKTLMIKTHGARPQLLRPFVRSATVALAAVFLLAGSARAQLAGSSPWENAVNVLQQAFTGPIAKGLALIAIVIGGLTFAFGEGGSKRSFAGILFGLGMAVLAVNFLSWLFGV